MIEVPDKYEENPKNRVINLDPYFYVPTFSEPTRKAPGRPRSERSLTPISPKPNKPVLKVPKFQVALPAPFLIEDGEEKWTLRCICGDHTTNGLLVMCEKCGVWQHAICMNLNPHTIPESYICETCSNKAIRCKCELNLNYRLSLVKCSMCGYHYHRKCAGLMYGPFPSSSFVCSFCGKSRFNYPKIKFPSSMVIENSTLTISQDTLGRIPPQFIGGPFVEFFKEDLMESTLTYKDLYESFYDRFRSFFFPCHPLLNNNTAKKRRFNLLHTFLSSSENVFKCLTGIDREQFVNIFDCLLNETIYKPSKYSNIVESGCDFSENARLEIPQISISSIKDETPVRLFVTDNGVISDSDIINDQYIMTCEGLVGDIEEFYYDDGVDLSLYQITGTRFVLDASRIPTQLTHKMKRSINGNCYLKIVQNGDIYTCALFAGPSHSSFYNNDEEFIIRAGEPLTLPIDFIPAIVDDFTKYMSWHIIENDDQTTARPSREDRGMIAAMRLIDQASSKRSKSAVENEDVIDSRKVRKSKIVPVKTEITLFSMFENEDPGAYFFLVGDDIEALKENTKSIAQPPVVIPTRGRPKPKIKKTQQTPKTHTGGTRGRPPKNAPPRPKTPSKTDVKEQSSEELEEESVEEEPKVTKDTEPKVEESKPAEIIDTPQIIEARILPEDEEYNLFSDDFEKKVMEISSTESFVPFKVGDSYQQMCRILGLNL